MYVNMYILISFDMYWIDGITLILFGWRIKVAPSSFHVINRFQITNFLTWMRQVYFLSFRVIYMYIYTYFHKLLSRLNYLLQNMFIIWCHIYMKFQRDFTIRCKEMHVHLSEVKLCFLMAKNMSNGRLF